MTKTAIHVDHIARVEGHGDVHVVIEDGAVKTCEMSVTEPARLFESMVIGRHFDEIPYIASRICGICSSSHVVTNLKAIESIFDIQVSDRTNALRELLVYGSYLQNHTTHLFVFAAPDFLGMKSVFPLAQVNRELYEKALACKALGNELCTKVGGRSVHPITAVVGGFTHEITSDEYLALAQKMDDAREFAVEVVDLFKSFQVPEMQSASDFLAMVQDGAYPVFASDTAKLVRDGRTFQAAEIEDVIEEYEMTHSGALFARVRDTQSTYMTSALARINASWDNLCRSAKVAAAKVGLRPPESNPFLNNVAQAVELVDVLDRCSAICRKLALGEDGYQGDAKPVDFQIKAGTGVGFTEAPRGALFHKLTLDEDGRVVRAAIVTPTAQNLASLEADMRLLAATLIEEEYPIDDIRMEIEKLVRAYDPCFSCSVH